MSKQLTYIYTTKEDEMLDEIVHDHYGTAEHLQMVMNANPGLSQYGARLPIGIDVTLPPEPLSETRYINYWS